MERQDVSSVLLAVLTARKEETQWQVPGTDLWNPGVWRRNGESFSESVAKPAGIWASDKGLDKILWET